MDGTHGVCSLSLLMARRIRLHDPYTSVSSYVFRRASLHGTLNKHKLGGNGGTDTWNTGKYK